MSEDIKSLSDLDVVSSEDTAAVEIAAPRVAVRDDLGRSYATGKRKDAVARVWIKPGSGKIVVNDKEMNGYFARPVLQMILRQPFQVAGVEDQFDVKATVKGGGLSGQAGAVKHGISKALQLYDPSLRAALKSAGFLTRDSRVVERKKFGKRKCVALFNSQSARSQTILYRESQAFYKILCLVFFVESPSVKHIRSKQCASKKIKLIL